MVMPSLGGAHALRDGQGNAGRFPRRTGQAAPSLAVSRTAREDAWATAAACSRASLCDTGQQQLGGLEEPAASGGSQRKKDEVTAETTMPRMRTFCQEFLAHGA
jgi:hypothetical protein